MFNTTDGSNKFSIDLIKSANALIFAFFILIEVLDIPDTSSAEVLDYEPQNIKNYYTPYIEYGSLQIKNWIGKAFYG